MKPQVTSRSIGRSIPLLWAFLIAAQLLADATPGVAPPHCKTHGASYAQWGAAWWQWMFSLHANVPPNPVLTKGPVDCSYGQSGQVWFLAGANASGIWERSCTIPTGTALFLPVLNGWADNVAVSPPLTVEQLEQLAASFADATELHASIDGRPVKNLFAYRAAYAPFGYTVPAIDNMLQYFGANAPGSDWPSTFVFPAASDGYWLMLDPLPPGVHVINFGGTAKNAIFQIDVTYTITVVSKGKRKD